jgi:outer membrane protein assembly factor BamB
MNTQHLSRWLVILGLFLLAILLLVSGTAVLARDDTDTVSHWLHFGYDNAFTAYNPLEKTISITNVAEMENRWGIGCYDGAFSVIFRTPAIYEGTLYSSGAGDRLTAYDARSGQELWQFGNGNAGWAPQPVVSSDGTVFYMEETNPTYLYAVNGDTGAQLWKAPLGFELGYSGAAEAVVTVD